MRASADEGWWSETMSVPQQETIPTGDAIRGDRAGSSGYRVGTSKVVQIPAWHRVRIADRPRASNMYHGGEDTERSTYSLGTHPTTIHIQGGIH